MKAIIVEDKEYIRKGLINLLSITGITSCISKTVTKIRSSSFIIFCTFSGE